MTTKFDIELNIDTLFELAALTTTEVGAVKLRRQLVNIHRLLRSHAGHMTRGQFAFVACDITRAVLNNLNNPRITAPSISRISGDADHLAAALCEAMAGRDTSFRAITPAFHNGFHIMDVALTVAVLGVLHHRQKPEQFTRDDIKDLTAAALAHDKGHPGGSNSTIDGYYQFAEKEDASWRQIRPLVDEAGYIRKVPGRKTVHNERRIHMRDAIRATDPKFGPLMAELAVRNFRTPKDKRIKVLQEAMDFADTFTDIKASTLRRALFLHPKAAEMSYVLSKADVAFSLLSPDLYLEQTQFLRDEFAATRTVSALQPAHFFDRIARVSYQPFLVPAVELLLGGPSRETRRVALRVAELVS